MSCETERRREKVALGFLCTLGTLLVILSFVLFSIWVGNGMIMVEFKNMMHYIDYGDVGPVTVAIFLSTMGALGIHSIYKSTRKQCEQAL